MSTCQGPSGCKVLCASQSGLPGLGGGGDRLWHMAGKGLCRGGQRGAAPGSAGGMHRAGGFRAGLVP